LEDGIYLPQRRPTPDQAPTGETASKQQLVKKRVGRVCLPKKEQECSAARWNITYLAQGPFLKGSHSAGSLCLYFWAFFPSSFITLQLRT